MSIAQAPRRAIGRPPDTQRVDAFRRFFAGEGFVAALIVVYVLVVSQFADGMLTPRNLLNVLSNLWPLAIIVIGQAFVLILGGIDLAQTAVANITNTFGALLLAQSLSPALFGDTVFWGSLVGESGGVLRDGGVAPAVVIMLVLGLGLGALNGVAVARLHMPPFMVTLGAMLLLGAVAVWMTRSENVASLPEAYLAIGNQGLGGPFTYAMLIAVVVGLASHYLLARTPFGAWLYAAGTNRQTSIVSGVPHDRTVVIAYALSGLLATVGGILYSTRLQAGRPTLADDMLLDIIGAAVIGGLSLFGGKGTILGAFLGAVFFVVLANSLNLLNLPFTVVFIVKGLVIVAAALLDVARARLTGADR
ncbi:ABC transporter permease [Georgenia yuyongxinii]|uniref:ABC transporter permease n=1 Tax=Georgenia yuyongxinii TaxID=2589797 RepID=A0A552WV30_9MICO|nr:ABC transporter permease [Georgenia yuyongxinii]TRW46700.1 ABC transporter permease [Georgenia yuyongxinii]